LGLRAFPPSPGNIFTVPTKNIYLFLRSFYDDIINNWIGAAKPATLGTGQLYSRKLALLAGGP
jgi:hypothetical protein